jgi:hypothetical protein
MTTFDSNNFKGQTLELGAAVWRGNLFERCHLTVNRPPIEFDGNTLNGCQIELGPEMVAAMRWFRTMAQMMPEIKPHLRRELGLDDNGEDVPPPVIN